MLQSFFKLIRVNKGKAVWVLPCVLLILSVFASYITVQFNKRDLEENFIFFQKEFMADLDRRLNTYNNVFYSAQGLFVASDYVSREEWSVFVDQLNLEKIYPAIRFFAYAEYVQSGSEDSFLQDEKDDISKQIKIFPEGDREHYAVVKYVEPYDDVGEKVIGFDILSEKVRREAVLSAAKNNNTSISGILNFPEHFGFNEDAPYIMMVKPVSFQNAAKASEVKGFIIGILSINKIFEELRHRNVAVDIFDGLYVNDNKLIYSSENAINTKYSKLMNSYSRRIYNHNWALRYTALPDIEGALNKVFPWIVLLIGFLLSLTSYLVLSILIRERQKALLLAKESIDELKEKEGYLKHAEEYSQLGYWKLDLETEEIFWSDEVFKIYGLSNKYSALKIEDVIEFYHPDDRELIKKTLEECIESKGSLNFTARLTQANKKVKLIKLSGCVRLDEFGEVTSLFGIIEDITKKNKAINDSIKYKEDLEKTLDLYKNSEKRLEAAIEGGALGVWDWDYQTHIVSFSKGWAEMLGYSLEELEPNFSTWEKLTHPDDLKFAKKKIQDYLEGLSPIYQAEFRMKHKDGDWRWILSRGKTIDYDGDGRPAKIMGTHTDITRLKQTEKKFIEAQKMEAIGKLAGGIAHDFNNLLTIAFGCTKLIRRVILQEDIDIEAIKKNLDTLDSTGKRGSELVKRLMLFSNQSELSPQNININDLIKNISKLISHSVTDMISIDYVFEEDLWDSYVDPAQLEHAVINLCVNARDAMQDGGRLIIKTENVKVAGKYSLEKGEFEEGDYVVLSLSDTGEGIDEEIQSRIFDPFFTTKDVGKGTGLGLSMVYGLIKDSNGFINVYSEKDHGATFRLYFPRSINAEDQIGSKAFGEDISEDLNGSETILVVEDETKIGNLVIDNLKLCGYDILYAENGDEALKVIRQTEKKINLLFSDISMPGSISGVTLANKVLEDHPDIKVLLTTGYTRENLPDQKLMRDRFFFISKPYNIDDLLRKIRKILD